MTAYRKFRKWNSGMGFRNLGSVGINFFFFFLLSTKPEIVVPGSGIPFRYFIFEISGKPSFVEAVFYEEKKKKKKINADRP
jgi:hypothetical protein